MLPKPQSCAQHWLDMQPAPGGRLCGQCHKVIRDFSKMSWKEIEQVQRENNHAVCGMYRPEQLQHWGQEVPTRKENLLKAAAATGLAVSLSLTAPAQTTHPADSLVLRGRVRDAQTREPLGYASLRLKQHQIFTVTDADGNFLLKAPAPLTDELLVTYLGYRNTVFSIDSITDASQLHPSIKHDQGMLDLALEPQMDVITYYVTRPTWKQRMKRKWDRLFRKQE